MKHILLLTLTLFTFSFAQVEKLKELYDAGRYEDCEFKANNFLYKEENAKNPMIHLYFAMCNFEFVANEEYKATLPEGYDEKTCEKYAIKGLKNFLKYDEDKEFTAESAEFIKRFGDYFFEAANNYMAEGNIRKAYSNYKNVTIVQNENEVVHFAIAVCEMQLDKPDKAMESFNIAVSKLATMVDLSEMSEQNKKLFRFSVMNYTEYLISVNKIQAAQLTMDFAYIYFENDTEFTAKYNAVMSL